MPRRPRTELPGGIHHVWQRGNNRRAIFVNDDDRQTFLQLLLSTVRKRDWHCLGFCLMENHFHLVIETVFPNLGLGMRDLCSRYAQLFNERRETGGGHVFQARFGSKLVRNDEQLAQLLRYVALNPVRARLCADPSAWPWSSHAALLGGGANPLIDVQRTADLLGSISGGQSSGAYAALFEPDGPLRHLPPDLSPWELRPALDEILSATNLAAAVRRAKRHGYRMTDVAAHLGISEVTLWRQLKETGSVPI